MITQLGERDRHAESQNIIQSILLTQFVEKTSPKTAQTYLPELTQALVNRLFHYCLPDENGNFGVIRGGSMRSFLLDNYVTDERFAELFGGIEPQLLGENPMAKQVVDKVFSLPKDIDIFLRFNGINNQAHQDNSLFLTLADELKLQWFTPIHMSGSRDKMSFSNGQHQITLFKHQTGVDHKQTLVKVDISQGNQALLKLHFGLIPDELESREDPRFYEEAADIDQEAVGYLTKDKEEILIRYFGLENVSYASWYLREHFFDPLLHPFRVDRTRKPDQLIASKLRQTNFRVALISWLFNIKGIVGISADLQQTPYYELFVKYGIPFERKPVDEIERLEMRQWFNENQQNLQDHFKLVASDLMFGLTVNPFLFFLFAFPTHVLDALPLGKKLDFNSLRHFLQSLAVDIGGDLTDSLLTLSMKYNMYLKTAQDTAIFQLLKHLNKSQTISAFLESITI